MHCRTLFTLLPLLPLLGLTATASPISTRVAEATEAAGCSDISFKSMSWTASNFDFQASVIYTTPAHLGLADGYASFDLFNPADQSTTHCHAASHQFPDFFYGTVQYKCDDTRSSFDFNRVSGQLRVNQSWVCSDRDPQHPITFTGRGDGKLTLKCTDRTWVNPKWVLGEIYSSRKTICAPAESEIKLTELSVA
ncbi:hypothetical protein VTI74DRAFT_3244 [Chaetomium olivicolor]